MMTALALPWFVLKTTGSAGRTGIVLAVEILPVALLGVSSGSLAARLGARRTMLGTNLLWAVLMSLIPVLHSLALLSFPILLILVFLAGALWTPFYSAQQALLPELVGEDERVLGHASALFQSATRMTYWVGPVLAGLLIAPLGAPTVLLIDAA